MKQNTISPYALTKWQGVKDLPEYLQPTEAHRLIEAAADNRRGERDSLFLDLLLQTGIRVSEALAATPSDIIEVDKQPVLVIKRGKGGKTRQVSLPTRLAYQLLRYQKEQGIGTNTRFFPITRQRAWQIIKLAAQRAGIDKRTYPHLFRHSYAIEFLKQTGHPQALMTLLGHSSPAMTLRYLRLLQVEDALKIAEGVEV
ncbi:Tyrosine recombinase XerD [subsurface metagenome]